MSSNSSGGSGGISFAGLLAIAFIVLKLTHVIAWSWWWVLAPLWAGAALVAVILVVVLLGAVIATSVESRSSRRSLDRYQRSLSGRR